ncbi:MAG: hypothetical protein KG075_09570 [Alphaproteobacteria bacterium]|nr:hypothetical protein [Alphaproteobacteria bacterium]
MSTFALVDRTGRILRRETMADAPQLSPEKGLRWLPDDPPDCNPVTQIVTRMDSIPVEATSVPYGVSFQPVGAVAQRIRDEAYRRIIKIFSASGNARDAEAKQRNLIAQATQLLRKGETNWLVEEAAAWAAGQALWDRVAALREDSNQLEGAFDAMDDTAKAAFDPGANEHWSE